MFHRPMSLCGVSIVDIFLFKHFYKNTFSIGDFKGTVSCLFITSEEENKKFDYVLIVLKKKTC